MVSFALVRHCRRRRAVVGAPTTWRVAEAHSSLLFAGQVSMLRLEAAAPPLAPETRSPARAARQLFQEPWLRLAPRRPLLRQSRRYSRLSQRSRPRADRRAAIPLH